MVKQINKIRDAKIIAYLRDHTYVETQAYFSISAQQISRIKKRAETEVPSTPEPESQIQDMLQGPADQAKDEKPTEPAKRTIAERSEPTIKPKPKKPESEKAISKGKGIDSQRFAKILACKSYTDDKNLYWEKKHLLAFFESFLKQYDSNIEIKY